MKKMILASFLMVSCNIHYSDGVRIGTISKISKRGIFCKTWEGEMYVAAQNVMQPEKWEFSVEDDTVAMKIGSAMRIGKQVELKYKQIGLTPPCSPDTSYRIVEVNGI